MPKKSQPQAASDDSDNLVDGMSRRYGPIVGGKDLFKALGFSNGQAFRQAARQGRLGVDVFSLPGRAGKFALTTEVATWIASANKAR